MRRSRLAAVAAVAAVVLTAVGMSGLAATGAAAQANLLANPGFETGSLSGWSCSPLDSATTSPVHSGSDALAGAVSASDDAQCTQSVSVQPSTAYTLTGWVEGNYVYLGDTGTGTSDTSNWTPAASSWTQLSTSFTTGAATTSVTIYVHGWYAQGSYHADDLSLAGPAGSGGGWRDLRAGRAERPDRHRHDIEHRVAVLDRAVRHGDWLPRVLRRKSGGQRDRHQRHRRRPGRRHPLHIHGRRLQLSGHRPAKRGGHRDDGRVGRWRRGEGAAAASRWRRTWT